PNKVLLDTAKPVVKFDKKLKEILKAMEETLRATKDPIGVGLAAPQVGLSMRIFQMKPTLKSPVTSYINPVIDSTSSEQEIPHFTNSENVEEKKPESSKNKLLEGCLSIPDIWGNVTRKKEVTLSWQDENENHFKQTFTGFPAIIVQHEVDHLNGILFTKHVMSQGEKLFKSHKNKEGEDEFEEIQI
ncbi:MAG: peptide deformylase, partial [Candidatus Levybacteria bacterium]|nr:peptide deformylase [Candidatus Levybacteria bacterium]